MTTKEKSALVRVWETMVSLYFIGFAVWATFRLIRVRGLPDGPLGLFLVALVTIGLMVALFFVAGWAFRKGWKSADAG